MAHLAITKLGPAVDNGAAALHSILRLSSPPLKNIFTKKAVLK